MRRADVDAEVAINAWKAVWKETVELRESAVRTAVMRVRLTPRSQSHPARLQSTARSELCAFPHRCAGFHSALIRQFYYRFTFN